MAPAALHCATTWCVTEQLIAARRTERLTVRAIAREARVASGVLYNYFADKEDLLAYGLLAHIETAAGTLTGPPTPGEGPLEVNLTTYLSHLLELHERILPAFAGLLSQPKVLQRFNALPATDKGGTLSQELAAHLRAEQRLGWLAHHLDTDAAAALLVGGCYALVLPRLFQAQPTAPLDVRPELIAGMVETFFKDSRPRAENEPD